MDAPERGALKLVWCVAVSLIVISILEIGLYVAQCYEPQHPASMTVFPFVLKSIPAALGVVMFIKAKSIAEWISDKLEL
jgi:hypothetical protein